ncbi:MAG: hypothetical protein OXP66_02825 [Candidatus Tectomicrobia bacterium]|nr:hypothetical protein [Candidatus Tectomicrobia bacterium]
MNQSLQQSAPPLLARPSEVLEGPDGKPALELQVNIEGRDRIILLPLDDMAK